MNQEHFKGKTALITGASRGIGRAIALELARRGVHIVVNFLRHEKAAADTVRKIESCGRKALLIRANVGAPREIRELVARVKNFSEGQLDFLIHNAALATFKPLLELRKNQFDLSIDINTWALVELARQLLPLLKHHSARIVVLSSRGAQRALPHYACAGASKAAVEALVRYLAAELGPTGIRVNALSAGPVLTDSLKAFPEFDQMMETAARAPLGRIGSPEDIARSVALLCSPDADWITGQVITADGGLSIL